MKNTTRWPLKQPRVRQPLREGFPGVQSLADPDALFDVLDAEIKKRPGGKDRTFPRAIVVAWPHKVAARSQKVERPAYVEKFLELAKERLDHRTRFYVADGLHEKLKLDRGTSTADTRYTHRQRYGLSQSFQSEALPQLRNSLYVVLDDAVETGTTLADFVSLLQTNGAHVLLTAVPSLAGPFPLRYPQHAWQDGRAQMLGEFFARAARTDGYDLTPDECLDMVDARMRKNGYSIETLTPGEFNELKDDFELDRDRVSFTDFLRKLGKPVAHTARRLTGNKPGQP